MHAAPARPSATATASAHRTAPAHPAEEPGGRHLAGVATMFASGLSNQVGAAIGSLAFPVLGRAGVVAVRQYVAAIALSAVGRPRLRSFTWRQWWPVILQALVFGTMNLSLYSAIDRVGLGLAVTLEFLGPLTIALATSRRRADACCALIAATGVVALMRPQPTADYVGMGLGLLAAACWASYILLSRTVGRRVPGAQGSAAAAGLSALLFLPVGLVLVVRHPPSTGALGYAVAAGVLSSAVPYLADMFTLRRVPARAFGLFMSVNPVLAAVVGWILPGAEPGMGGVGEHRRDRRREHAQHPHVAGVTLHDASPWRFRPCTARARTRPRRSRVRDGRAAVGIP